MPEFNCHAKQNKNLESAFLQNIKNFRDGALNPFIRSISIYHVIKTDNMNVEHMHVNKKLARL